MRGIYPIESSTSRDGPMGSRRRVRERRGRRQNRGSPGAFEPRRMALDARDFHVTSPCPIDLDETRMRGTGDAWHCGHCSKTVHVLSSMTETQARTLLAAHAGQDICVSYSMSRAGEIRFRPEPVVPISALSRRPRIAAAAALGLSAAMAACAPHENPRILPPPFVDVATPGNLTIPVQRYQPPPPIEPDVIAVDGGMRVPPMPVPQPTDVQASGGLRAPMRGR
jgi:hypothetical protein